MMWSQNAKKPLKSWALEVERVRANRQLSSLNLNSAQDFNGLGYCLFLNALATTPLSTFCQITLF